MNRREKIERLTGLVFCDEDCGCGENSQLWHKQTPSGSDPSLPGWMNAVDTSDVWDWLVENGKVQLRSSNA